MQAARWVRIPRTVNENHPGGGLPQTAHLSCTPPFPRGYSPFPLPDPPDQARDKGEFRNRSVFNNYLNGSFILLFSTRHLGNYPSRARIWVLSPVVDDRVLRSTLCVCLLLLSADPSGHSLDRFLQVQLSHLQTQGVPQLRLIQNHIFFFGCNSICKLK